MFCISLVLGFSFTWPLFLISYSVLLSTTWGRQSKTCSICLHAPDCLSANNSMKTPKLWPWKEIKGWCPSQLAKYDFDFIILCLSNKSQKVFKRLFLQQRLFLLVLMVQTLPCHRTPVQVNVICVTSLMKAADRSPYSRWGKFCSRLKKAFLLPHGSSRLAELLLLL